MEDGAMRFGRIPLLVIWWLRGPDATSVKVKASEELKGFDFTTLSEARKVDLLKDAKESLAFSLSTTERLDRKSFGLLPVTLTVVTAIITGIGLGTLKLPWALPSLGAAVFSAISIAQAVRPIANAGMPLITSQLTSAIRNEWPQGLTTTLHSAVSVNREAQQWRTTHITAGIVSLMLAVALIVIPVLAGWAAKA